MSMVLFGEPLSLLMGVGIVIVIAGVLCVELGSQAAQAKTAGSEVTS
jgi:small multidrug resistance pump